MSARSSGLLLVSPLGEAVQHEIRSSLMPKHHWGGLMLSGAGQVTHFSFWKVNSGITVFELQSNLPGMRFLMRLIGRRGTWPIASRGCCRWNNLQVYFFLLSLPLSVSVRPSTVTGGMRPFKLIRGFQCKLQQLKGLRWGTSRASLVQTSLS